MRCATLTPVDVTPERIEKIPTGNLRIPRGEFANLWRRAEHLGAQPATTPTGNFHLGGILDTCRWLAGQPIPGLNGRMAVPDSPYRHWQVRADPETINAEYIAAATCIGQTGHHPNRTNLAKGVEATLAWCWNGTDDIPLKEPTTATG